VPSISHTADWHIVPPHHELLVLPADSGSRSARSRPAPRSGRGRHM